MSDTTIARFPHGSSLPHRDNDPDAAHQARRRISGLPDPYLAHAAPNKEDLVGAIDPVSAALEAGPAIKPLPLATVAGDAGALDVGNLAAPPATDSTATTNPLEQTPRATTAAAPGTSFPAALPEEPKPRSLPSRLRPLLTGVLTFIGLFIIFKAPIFLSQLNYLTQPKTAATPATQASLAVPAAPTISIPKINVNAPVVYATDNNENDILTDLESGVVHYADTAVPGQPGNSVIFGHSSNDWWEPGNYKFVFVLLDKLQAGDTFTVNYNSHQYLYQVTGTQVVDPTDLGVLNQTSYPEMTLITCTPPGTSWKRLVVTAKQISPAPNTVAAAPSATQGNGSLPSNSPSLTQQIGSWWQSIVKDLDGNKSSSSTGTGAAAPSGTLPGN
ncbi:MAG TPA: sortase [Candidatus Saccharimonadales bacterium]|nr:sortase [Candidatus Saccharimonadales bacterium]